MHRPIVWIRGTVLVATLLILTACGRASFEEPPKHLDKDWQQLAPGFRVALGPDAIAFHIDYEDMDRAAYLASAEALETRIADHPFHRHEWQQMQPAIEANLELIETHFGGSAGLAAELERLAAEDPVTQGHGYAHCSIAATAGPTTAGPGAKAYASASCSSTSAKQRSVDTSTTAKAGNTRVSDSDSGRYDAYSSSAAYGSYDCYSRAEASKTYSNFFGMIVTETTRDTNRSCT